MCRRALGMHMCVRVCAVSLFRIHVCVQVCAVSVLRAHACFAVCYRYAQGAHVCSCVRRGTYVQARAARLCARSGGTRVFRCVQPPWARSGAHACSGAWASRHTRADGVSVPCPRAPQQLLPQPRALALDGAGQLSLYTSPSLPNISLGLQATVTVTSSHLSVSGDAAPAGTRGPGTPRRGRGPHHGDGAEGCRVP